MKKFYFFLEESVNNVERFSPPEDPLGELSHLEMGLRRFCFENNQKVLIKLGNKRKEILLDPDISLILEELPEKIYQLLTGQTIELDFPESCFTICFDAVDIWKVNCIWKEYGYYHEAKTFSLEREQVLDVLKNFLNEIISKAVKKRYISDREKEEFMQSIIK
ncbi:hypothetical protein [Trichormus variabilis]|uniref:Uncharacterized protein n=1 Tax=Trichormus variabilis SAG 1403-4b TaxID=447716 RepID=A0A433UHR3_ANAVA|nr:hypothetical protein [Trichormus variabilis]MBD2626762.1 hypothetical protein [Trichormus variabilis FACHB-164]RUS93377.1 hypothetical protein DSM107003_44330 [Trichormus variabilis SAG 1403-4b]